MDVWVYKQRSFHGKVVRHAALQLSTTIIIEATELFLTHGCLVACAVIANLGIHVTHHHLHPTSWYGLQLGFIERIFALFLSLSLGGGLSWMIVMLLYFPFILIFTSLLSIDQLQQSLTPHFKTKPSCSFFEELHLISHWS